MLPLGWKVLIAVIFGVTIFIAGPVLAADTVKIVHIDPFSGPFKTNGDRMYMATQFAVDEINASGGLLGKRVDMDDFHRIRSQNRTCNKNRYAKNDGCQSFPS